MREELLGQLTNLYDQELARCGDEERAIAAAVSRFGTASELRQELQQTVPLIERILWARLPLRNWASRRPGESGERYIWRVARWQIAYMTAFKLAITLLAISMTLVRKPRTGEPLVGPLPAFMSTVTVVYVVVVTLFPFACEYLRVQFAHWQNSAGNARRPIGLRIVATFSLLAFVAAGGMSLSFAMLPYYLGISAMYPSAFWVCVSGAALLAIPLSAIQAWQQAQAARQFDDWDGTETEASE